MQGLSDGYFVIPYTVGNYLASSGAGTISPDGPEVKEVLESVKERTSQLLSISGKKSARSYHKELGQIMWEYAGMARNATGLQKAIGEIQDLRDHFQKNLLGTRHW
jgi:succinate dehydrogenase / fumarate reductase flavoprotein subunit